MSDPGLGTHVDEQEPRVRLDGDRVQRVVVPVERLVLVHVGRPDEPPVEVVGPRVIRALEGLVDVPARAQPGLVEQLRPSMGADVVEAAELAVPIARDDHGLAGHVANEEVARVRDLLRPADADPVAPPDALALVRVDRLGRVVESRTRVGRGRHVGAWIVIESPQRVRGKPRSILLVPGSGQRDVTILARV